jgi:hypothetical protein
MEVPPVYEREHYAFPWKQRENGVHISNQLWTIFCYTRIYKIMFKNWVPTSRDSAVGTATGYGLDGWGVGVRVPVGAGLLSSPHRPELYFGPTQPPIQRLPGALSPGIKRPGSEADHSPPTTAEVKNTRINTAAVLPSFVHLPLRSSGLYSN